MPVPPAPPPPTGRIARRPSRCFALATALRIAIEKRSFFAELARAFSCIEFLINVAIHLIYLLWMFGILATIVIMLASTFVVLYDYAGFSFLGDFYAAIGLVEFSMCTAP